MNEQDEKIDRFHVCLNGNKGNLRFIETMKLDCVIERRMLYYTYTISFLENLS